MAEFQKKRSKFQVKITKVFVLLSIFFLNTLMCPPKTPSFVCVCMCGCVGGLWTRTFNVLEGCKFFSNLFLPLYNTQLFSATAMGQ